jgi:hypothetical protein
MGTDGRYQIFRKELDNTTVLVGPEEGNRSSPAPSGGAEALAVGRTFFLIPYTSVS